MEGFMTEINLATVYYTPPQSSLTVAKHGKQGWKKRAIANPKKMRELKLVIQKFKADAQKQNDKSQMVVPVRVTRSVGLQGAIGHVKKSDSRLSSHPTASKPSKPNHATSRAKKEKRSEKPPPSPIQKLGIATKSTNPARSKAPVICKPATSKLAPKPRAVAKKPTAAKLSPIRAKVVPPPPLTPAPTSSKTADVIEIDRTDDDEVPCTQVQVSPRPSTVKSLFSPKIMEVLLQFARQHPEFVSDIVPTSATSDIAGKFSLAATASSSPSAGPSGQSASRD